QSQHRLRLSEMTHVPLTIAETLEIPYAPTRTTTGMRNPLALVTDRREAAWMRVGNPFHIKRPPQRSRVSMINGTAQNRKSPCHGLGKHPQPRPSNEQRSRRDRQPDPEVLPKSNAHIRLRGLDHNDVRHASGD